jgi:foldase protein PrsA
MNSSRKVIKKKAQLEENDGRKKADPVKRKRNAIVAVFSVVLVFILAGVLIDQFTSPTVIKVNDQKISEHGIMFPIYLKESQYEMYDAMYQQYYGSSIWSQTYQGSDLNVPQTATMAEGLKQEIQDELVSDIVLAKEAEKADIKLTSDEKKTADQNAANGLKGLSSSQKSKLYVSSSSAKKFFERQALANKYEDQKKDELKKKVDTDAVKAGINKDDYRQYDVEAYYVSFLSDDDTDSDSADESSDDESSDDIKLQVDSAKKEELFDKLQAVLDKAKDSGKFEDLIDDNEEDIQYSSESFTEKDGWSIITDDKILDKVKAMKNGDISDKILEDDEAGNYVIVKMVNNNNDAAYNSEVDTEVTSKVNDQYNDWYEKLLKKSYKVKYNEKWWDGITMGQVTSAIVTPEQLTQMAQEASETSSGSDASSSESSSSASSESSSSASSESSSSSASSESSSSSSSETGN